MDGFADSSEKIRVYKADEARRYSLNFKFHRKSPFVPAADACLRIVNKTYITTLSLVINIHKHYIRNVIIDQILKAYEIRTRQNHENYRNRSNSNSRNSRNVAYNKLHSNNEHQQV